MSSDVLNNSYVIGLAKQNLVLQTAGRVYIKKQDKYYEISTGNSVSSEEESTSSSLPDIILVDTADAAKALEYPGDGKLIVGKDGSMFVTSGGSLVEWKPTVENNVTLDTTEINGVLTINYPEGTPLIINGHPDYPPFTINSSELVEFLNAQYLNGYSSDDFTKKKVDETITGNWTFGNINLTGVIGDGYTTFDIETSTLIVDNLVVRNKVTLPYVEDEHVVDPYKIFGTNEETWVGKEFYVSKFSTNPFDDDPPPVNDPVVYTGILQQSEEATEDDLLELSNYLSIGAILKSENYFYQIVTFEYNSVEKYLFFTCNPLYGDTGSEGEEKLVVVGHTTDINKKGGITMNASNAMNPYLDVLTDTQYEYTGDWNTITKLDSSKNIVGRFGNLSALPATGSWNGGQNLGSGIFLKGNTLLHPTESTDITTTVKSHIENATHSGNGGYTGDANLAIIKPLISAGADTDNSFLLNPEGSGYLANGGLLWYGRPGAADDTGYIRMTNGVISNTSLGWSYENQANSLDNIASKVYISNDGSGKIGTFTWDKDGNAIATTTKTGVVQIGDGLKITADGITSVKVGSGLSINSDGEVTIDGGGTLDPSLLPIASTTKLGGIIVGNGLIIDSTGVLELGGGEIDPLLLPEATTDSLGAVIIGEGVKVSGSGSISVGGNWSFCFSTANTKVLYADCGNMLKVIIKYVGSTATPYSVYFVPGIDIAARIADVTENTNMWFTDAVVSSLEPAVVYNIAGGDVYFNRITYLSVDRPNGSVTVNFNSSFTSTQDVVHFWLPMKLSNS